MSVDVSEPAVEDKHLTTLNWVRAEILKSLAEAQQALELYATDPDDCTPLRYCATYLHQVFGTLQMVEIYSAARLAEEMESVIKQLISQQLTYTDEVRKRLLESMGQFASYLQMLDARTGEDPAALVPVINRLRTLRGEPTLNNTFFFNPELDVEPPQNPDGSGPANHDIQAYARQQRSEFLPALLSWIRDRSDKHSLEKISRILDDLQTACESEDARRVWWIARSVIEAIAEGGLDASGPVALLLNRIDSEIKRLIDHGESVFQTKPANDLIKNYLYYIARAESSGPLVSAIKDKFKLGELVPEEAMHYPDLVNPMDSMANIIRDVVSITSNDLLEVNELLESFAADPKSNQSTLTPLPEKLGRVADTLDLLGHQGLCKLTRDQANNIQTLLTHTTLADEATLLDVASKLVFIESQLDSDRLAHPKRHRKQLSGATSGGQKFEGGYTAITLAEKEQKQVAHQVVSEALADLAMIKQALSDYEQNSSDSENIGAVPGLFERIQGAMTIIGHNRVAELITGLAGFVKSRLQDPDNPVTSTQFDTLADAITSIDYYFQALLEDAIRPEAVLSVAEISLEQLQAHSPRLESVDSGHTRKSLQHAAEESTQTTDADADYDAGLLAVFIEEANDLHEMIEQLLSSWTTDPDNQLMLANLQRALHTLKGSARMANISAISDLAHAQESLLESIKQGWLEISKDTTTFLHSCNDWLAGSLELASRSKPVKPARELLARIETLTSSGSKKGGAEARPESPKPAATTGSNEIERFIQGYNPEQDESTALKSIPESDDYIRISSKLLSGLIQHSTDIEHHNRDIKQRVDEYTRIQSSLSHIINNLIDDQARQLETEIGEHYYDKKGTRGETATEDLDNLSKLQQHSTEIDQQLNELRGLQHALQSLLEKTSSLISLQENETQQLQQGLLQARLLPVSSILPRLRRILRHTCMDLGKQAELSVNGAEVLIDRAKLKPLVPILEHLLRNALDHGIESPEQRKDLGKALTGKIHISFRQNNGSMLIDISDDGAGINIPAMRKKAEEMNLIGAKESLSDEEIIQYAFTLGLTTAMDLNQVSGRGIGLNVVNTELNKLRGRLDINTRAGKGTTFSLSIPLNQQVLQPPEKKTGDVTDRQLKVMVVDDSITARTYTSSLLEQHHYKTITASDGQAALELLDKQIPDIILLDVDMPRMNGYELVKEMQKDDKLRNIPIIMVTSHDKNDYQERARDMGIEQYMVKPFDEQELIHNIQSLTLSHGTTGNH